MENWRDVPGTKYYEVSDFGRVRSKDRPSWFRNHISGKTGIKIVKGKLLRLPFNDRYLHFIAFENCKRKSIQVHRAVALAFIENVKCLPLVNHLDGNKHNNHISNLEWCTSKENIQHSFSKGLNHSGEKCGSSKFKQSQVDEIRKLYEDGKSQSSIARMFNTSQANIWSIVKYKTWVPKVI